MQELDRNPLLDRREFVRRSGQLIVSAAALVAGSASAAARTAKEVNPFAYDVSRLLQTDPKLVQYREVARWAAPAGARRLVMGPADRLWLAAGRQAVEMDAGGEIRTRVSVGADITALAVDADGTLYLALRDHVEVWQPNGERRAVWAAPGERAYFTGLAVGETDVFVADAGHRLLWRYDKSGQLRGRLGQKSRERNIPGFVIPSPFFDVKRASDGRLHVTNTGRHRVEVFTPEGDLESAWGQAAMGITGFCGCCNPIALDRLPDGRYVTFEKGLPRVKIYSATGEFESVVAGPESFPENARVCGSANCSRGGLDGAVDAQGRIYILDRVRADVRVMERLT